MAEIFRKGAHVVAVHDGWVSQKTLISQPTTPSACASRVGAYRVGTRFIVKPRGSPNIWKLYETDTHGHEMLFQHEDLDVVLAFAGLTYG